MMKSENTPSSRLITQNMLTSASLFERSSSIKWAAIQDLSTFIDIFCLYDSAAVLGRAGMYISGFASELLGAVNDAKFINIRKMDSTEINQVVLTARGHFVTFLDTEESTRFDDLLRFSLSPHGLFELIDYPDSEREIDLGTEWLLTTPTHAELVSQLQKEHEFTRSALFLSRSFLYLAYADLHKIAFTPDAVRSPVLSTVLDKEEQFRGKLISQVKSAWETSTPGDTELLTRVSPLAAYVFRQASPNKKRIVPVGEQLWVR